MKLEQIGFYTLSDQRAATASLTSNLQRCELLLTGRCNFKCPYCRKVGGPDLPISDAMKTVMMWSIEGLKAIRFSGGEPTLYAPLVELVQFTEKCGIEHIAVSTNGSASSATYDHLLLAGVNDFSVSLDACCAEDGDKMSGGIKGAWDKVTKNIAYLSKHTYVTVGVVLTPENASTLNNIIRFADSLGVSDIRIIPAAQVDDRLRDVQVDDDLLAKYPILKYRIDNVKMGLPVRGMSPYDSPKCGLVLDDMAVCENKHYPCIIYLREGGDPIGEVGYTMREDRKKWFETHDCFHDKICSWNCLDVCVEYNNRFEELNGAK